MNAHTSKTTPAGSANLSTQTGTDRVEKFPKIAERLRTIEELDIAGKDVVLRVDANVPVSLDGKEILEIDRIEGFLPTIAHLCERNARAVFVMAHLGKGDPKRDSLVLVADVIQKAVSKIPSCGEFIFAKDYGTAAANAAFKKTVDDLAIATKKTVVVLLENLRFNKGEKANDQAFAESLAILGDCYINDAFGTAHRSEDASIDKLAAIFAKQGKAAAGLLMMKEVARVEKVMTNPATPLVVVMGGAKVETKAPILTAIAQQGFSDLRVLLAGHSALGVLLSRGVKLGTYKLDEEKLQMARDLDAALTKHCRNVVLPVDFVVGKSPDAQEASTVDYDKVPEGSCPFDIGPKSQKLFVNELGLAKTVVANGTPGVYENPLFAEGTKVVMGAIAKLPKETVVLVGGGDSGPVAKGCGIAKDLISTGGGALLAALEHGPGGLPALLHLERH